MHREEILRTHDFSSMFIQGMKISLNGLDLEIMEKGRKFPPTATDLPFRHIYVCVCIKYLYRYKKAILITYTRLNF